MAGLASAHELTLHSRKKLVGDIRFFGGGARTLLPSHRDAPHAVASLRISPGAARCRQTFPPNVEAD